MVSGFQKLIYYKLLNLCATSINSSDLEPDYEGVKIIMMQAHSVNKIRHLRTYKQLPCCQCTSQENRTHAHKYSICPEELSQHQADTEIVKSKAKSLLEVHIWCPKIISLPENYSGVADVLQELQLKIQHGH